MNQILERLGNPSAGYYDKALEDARRLRKASPASATISFEAPRALVDEAMRATGVTDPAELALLGLAVLVGPDPVAEIMSRRRGALGPDFELDV